MFTRIDHVELTPSDLERTLTFYRDALGFSLTGRYPVDAPPLHEIAYLSLGDSTIELLGIDAPEAVEDNPRQVGYRGLALEVEDMEQAITYLANRGIPVSWGPVNLGNAIRAEIRDPDGLIIELRQWLR